MGGAHTVPTPPPTHTDAALRELGAPSLPGPCPAFRGVSLGHRTRPVPSSSSWLHADSFSNLRRRLSLIRCDLVTYTHLSLVSLMMAVLPSGQGRGWALSRPDLDPFSSPCERGQGRLNFSEPWCPHKHVHKGPQKHLSIYLGLTNTF